MPRQSFARAVCAVLAAIAIVEVLRRHRRLQRALTAERAGHRLVDQVVHGDLVDELRRLRRTAERPPLDLYVNRPNSQEGGLS